MTMPLTDDGRGRVLANGVEMPLLGLGVWQIRDGSTTEQAVVAALEAGYRHIDTARIYKNEKGVGAGLRAAGVPREEVFVATKFNPRDKDPVHECEESLRLLGLDYVDLYLVHWPTGDPRKFWDGMEQVAARGLARAVGVSNYSADQQAALLAATSTPPTVNQVEFSPFQYRRALLEASEAAGVLLEAYSPLTRGNDLHNATIGDVAERAGRTPAQVLLRWAVQRGVPVIPKSKTPERIVENAQIFDFTLPEEDMAALDALDRTGGTASAQ